MWRYIVKRILWMIPVIIGISLIVFLLLNIAPGDPAQLILGGEATEESLEALKEEMGLNDPPMQQYFRYMKNFLKGDLGVSYRNQIDVKEQLLQKLPNTLILAFAATLFMIVVGIPVGVISAKKQYSVLDNITMVGTLIGASAPGFWFALVFVIIFSLNLKWFPSSGMGSGFGPMLKSLVLPAITLGINNMALVARMTRSSMLEVMREDYISTARAKGISERAVTWKHMLRNALLPIVTVVGARFGVLLGGSIAIETVFAWPGVGNYVIAAVNARDMPATMGSVLVLSIVFSFVNLIVDILYAYIDPRIKAQYIRKGGTRK